MPRKNYTPKNRYCKNSNLSEDIFLVVLWYYLQTAPATEAHTAIKQDKRFAGNEPSERTISAYYKKIGEFLFRNTFLVLAHEVNEKLDKIELEYPVEYENIVVGVGENWARLLISKLSYNDFSIITDEQKKNQFYDDYIVELRKISAVRKGLRGNLRGDMALAYWRSFFSARVKEEEGATMGYDLNYATTMYIFLATKKWLEDEPL